MAGPANAAELAAELASRPGHTNLRSTLMRWVLITVSLTFLGALLAAPLAAVFATAEACVGDGGSGPVSASSGKSRSTGPAGSASRSSAARSTRCCSAASSGRPNA